MRFYAERRDTLSTQCYNLANELPGSEFEPSRPTTCFLSRCMTTLPHRFALLYMYVIYRYIEEKMKIANITFKEI